MQINKKNYMFLCCFSKLSFPNATTFAPSSITKKSTTQQQLAATGPKHIQAD
jgi:hypothetical protein